MKLRARHYAAQCLVDITIESGIITDIQYPRDPAPDQQFGWVAPAFFDLQINGCDGISFNSPQLTVDDIRHVVGVCRKRGICSLCPTLVTNSFDAIHHGFSTLAQACEDPALARALPCFHLEGPYINGDDGPRGAHPKAHVRPPDWDEFRRWQDAADARIRLVTLAPEHDGALPFIEKLTAAGVVVALGHSAATGVQIRDAIKAGAKLGTHLGNGCHPMLPRHDNVIWEQLAADDLWISLICDGHHLPPSLIATFLRVKTPARTILTCDAGSLAGLPPGRYDDWGGEFDVLPEGKIVVPGTPFLAGSWAFTDQCVGHVLKVGGISLRDAVDMAGARPRELLGLPVSRLAVGEPAELVLFDWEPGGEFRVTGVV
jgi:N-acetylglucosamine-6-phosphate deacetylase